MDTTTLDNLRARLAADPRLLGPCAPLCAAYEEVLRAWRGLPARGARMAELKAIRDDLLTGTASGGDPSGAPHISMDGDLGLLLATLAALGRERWAWPEGAPADACDPTWLPVAMAKLPTTPAAEYLERFPATLGPGPLTLLAFLSALHHDALDGPAFAAYVLDAGTLMPEVSPHRPRRRLHGLLDYLGLSDEPHVQWRYRELARRIWPTASTETWDTWRWVRTVGDPGAAASAAAALEAGDWTLPLLHALRHFPAPAGDWLAGRTATVRLAAALLREEPALMPAACGGADAARWLAGARAPEAAPWWPDWLANGVPAARECVTRLQAVAVPEAADRHTWLAAGLLPGYRRIVANLLLSRAALGEGLDELLALARGGDADALRALGYWATPDEALVEALLSLRERHVAASEALGRLARRMGLPDVAELERRHVWATAWRREALGQARVRTDWTVGPYRLRLSIARNGRAQLDALGPEGPLARAPGELRDTEAYREARAAQHEVEAQHRRFRAFLERAMVEQCPIAPAEWRYLLENPVFAWLAERLVWRTSDGEAFLWAAPERWERADGTAVSLDDLPAHTSLVVAHPAGLPLESLAWWQAMAASRQVRQPIRQLFREVYLPDEAGCARFAGRQVAPARAYALLRTAGFAPGSGVATRQWPGGVTAHIRWAADATGRELFGRHARASVMTGDAWFSRGGEALPVAEVDAVVYSETLRAADLLTARAGVGEGDLTSDETVAVRTAILRDVARAAGVTGILAPEGERHAVILGTRATYRLSLANGAVFLEPEGRQVVLPDEGDEAEDGTGAIVMTALRLADDASIADPAFLAQLPSYSVAGSTNVNPSA